MCQHHRQLRRDALRKLGSLGLAPFLLSPLAAERGLAHVTRNRTLEQVGLVLIGTSALCYAAIVVWADRRFTMGHGRAFALYVLLYCVGRIGFELLRIDTATQIFGIRINVFTAGLIGLGALVYIVVSARTRPGREASVYRPGREPTPVG